MVGKHKPINKAVVGNIPRKVIGHGHNAKGPGRFPHFSSSSSPIGPTFAYTRPRRISPTFSSLLWANISTVTPFSLAITSPRSRLQLEKGEDREEQRALNLVQAWERRKWDSTKAKDDLKQSQANRWELSLPSPAPSKYDRNSSTAPPLEGPDALPLR